jgi:hypothetical protein
MRSRDMMTKLDRLPTRKEEVKVWDLSLLSPAKQDRAYELMGLIGRAEDLEANDLQGVLVEFDTLVEGLPMLAADDREQGPMIEVPKDLEHYWRWSQKASEWRHYSFHLLGKVQTLRFVELCRAYGYGTARGQVKEQITPLADWGVADRAEMARLLDIAAGQD